MTIAASGGSGARLHTDDATSRAQKSSGPNTSHSRRLTSHVDHHMISQSLRSPPRRSADDPPSSGTSAERAGRPADRCGDRHRRPRRHARAPARRGRGRRIPRLERHRRPGRPARRRVGRVHELRPAGAGRARTDAGGRRPDPLRHRGRQCRSRRRGGRGRPVVQRARLRRERGRRPGRHDGGDAGPPRPRLRQRAAPRRNPYPGCVRRHSEPGEPHRRPGRCRPDRPADRRAPASLRLPHHRVRPLRRRRYPACRGDRAGRVVAPAERLRHRVAARAAHRGHPAPVRRRRLRRAARGRLPDQHRAGRPGRPRGHDPRPGFRTPGRRRPRRHRAGAAAVRPSAALLPAGDPHPAHRLLLQRVDGPAAVPGRRRGPARAARRAVALSVPLPQPTVDTGTGAGA